MINPIAKTIGGLIAELIAGIICKLLAALGAFSLLLERLFVFLPLLGVINGLISFFAL
jgi:hypothetical protein